MNSGWVLSKPGWFLNPEGLGFRGEGEGPSGYGKVVGIVGVYSLYSGGRYAAVLYRDDPAFPEIVKRRIGLNGDIRELGSRRSIRRAVAALFPGLVAAAFHRAMGSADSGPGTGLAPTP